MRKVKNTVFLVILILTVVYFYSHADSLKLILLIKPADVLVLFLLAFLSFYVLSLQFYYVMKIFHIELPFAEFFGLTICNTMFNYYLPARGGMVVRALYLKKRYRFQYAHYVSFMAGTMLISFNVTALFGLVLSAILHASGYDSQRQLVLIFAGLLLFTALATLIVLALIRKDIGLTHKRFFRILDDIRSGLEYFRNNRQLILNFTLVHLCFIFTMAARLYWCFKSLGLNVDIFQILTVRAMANFSMVISLTPGNLGIREGIIGYFTHLLGVPLSDALTAAAVDRFVGVITVFALGLYYSKKLLGGLDIKAAIGNKSAEEAE
jgi:uncharacterized protein (TIRG00374 family)